MQVYELHNAGAMTVHYQVDESVLSRLQIDNFNHPVLQCLNPNGTVLPGQTALLEWIFSPLEAKLYQVRIIKTSLRQWNSIALQQKEAVARCCCCRWCDLEACPTRWMFPSTLRAGTPPWWGLKAAGWELQNSATRTCRAAVNRWCQSRACWRGPSQGRWGHCLTRGHVLSCRLHFHPNSAFFSYFSSCFIVHLTCLCAADLPVRGQRLFWRHPCLLQIVQTPLLDQPVSLELSSFHLGQESSAGQGSRRNNTTRWANQRNQKIHIRSEVPHLKAVLLIFPQLVEIQPDEGTLSPGETVLFVLTFISSEHPTCYQFDVFCQVPDWIGSLHAAHVYSLYKVSVHVEVTPLCPPQILQEDELVQYRNALQRWEKEKARQQNEFIITDKKLSKTQPILVEDVTFLSIFTLLFLTVYNHCHQTLLYFVSITGTCTSSETRATNQEVQGDLF